MMLHVGGLSNDKKETDVEEVFAGVCLRRSVTIIRDIKSGKSRGFVIVKPLDEEQDNFIDVVKKYSLFA